ncbi:MAG: hypothetical protein QOG65_359 [Actinomycetota bacterium]|jgi:hypothetical protein|nr:hypothetical protein [Actinomycetota bacterium]
MVRPTDGNAQPHDQPDWAGNTDHPDLTGIAGEMRAEWRAEQESAAADAAAQWRHGRSLTDWLRARMHAGDRIAVRVASQFFVGLVDEVGDDLLALRCGFGRVEIQLSAVIPIAIEFVEHATDGGRRAPGGRTFHAALVARDAQRDVSVGTMLQPEGVEGTLLVGRDFVSVVNRSSVETVVPLPQVAWVTVSRH